MFYFLEEIMKKVFTKFVSLVCCLALICGYIPTISFASYSGYGDDMACFALSKLVYENLNGKEGKMFLI